MKYNYICSLCNNKKSIDFPMGKAENIVKCDCGGDMKQDFLGKLKTIQSDLPEDYKAMSEFHSVDYGGTDEDMQNMLLL